MNLRLLSAVVFSLALGAAFAQDAPPPAGQAQSPGAGGGQGQRGGRGGGSGFGFGGRGVLGTVTEVAADHYAIKTDAGQTYIVHFSANTRILKQPAQHRGSGEGGGNREQSAPQTLKPSDIKVGDAITAVGEVDDAAKSVGAVAVFQLDPERAKQMREMQANFGKTWLMGKVTAINEAKVTLMGSVDYTPHAFQADENTTFRKRREPITLADIQVGDSVRVEGAVKDGVFVATAVSVMGMPPGGTPNLPRDAPPAPQPK
ncbi:MAG: DUF5666 domain-containing protein [Terracidiphilus sp.]|jgi:hypothetical protein